MASIRHLLESATNKLKRLDTASLDSEVLLSFVLEKPREYLLAHPEEIVADDKIERFNSLIQERAEHKPIAYLIKQKEFYGRPFFVDERVHIPRPATEDLIDYFKEFVPADFSGAIADIGTGSGCIAVTLALIYPQAKIIAADISEDALAVAAENARRHNVASKIKFLRGDLLAPLSAPIDIIVSNPPYGWEQGWSDDLEVAWQPKISYHGGNNGLALIKRILKDLPHHLKDSGQAFIKFDPRRRQAIESLLGQTPFSWQIKKDSAGWDRIVRLTY